MQRARIKISCNKINELNEICRSIADIVEKTKAKIHGPIPLPTKRMKLTTRKSPDGEGKASWERYEMRIHKRLLDLDIDDRTLRLIMRIPIPDSVSISIELLENK
ncbi:MAG: 30S ribosomal protein S10 [Nanoarchaeota archaeon]|nr:30S ribosomal protein S10 [Nanoarchaeota archaeon]